MKRLILVLVAGLSACEPSPAEVYEEAKSAAENNAWEQVLTHFDSKSQTLWTGLGEISEQTSRKLSYGVRIEKVHNWGTVLEERIEGSRAELKVGRERNPEWVFFVVEDGAWKIRGCAMDSFWVSP